MLGKCHFIPVYVLGYTASGTVRPAPELSSLAHKRIMNGAA
jgi:hypothetical protein